MKTNQYATVASVSAVGSSALRDVRDESDGTAKPSELAQGPRQVSTGLDWIWLSHESGRARIAKQTSTQPLDNRVYSAVRPFKMLLNHRTCDSLKHPQTFFGSRTFRPLQLRKSSVQERGISCPSSRTVSITEGRNSTLPGTSVPSGMCDLLTRLWRTLYAAVTTEHKRCRSSFGSLSTSDMSTISSH